MNQDRIDIEFSKIKNLTQYKKMSQDKLYQIARKRAIEYHVEIESLFNQKEDKKKAIVLLNKYLDDYIPETTSDINTLRSILFLEILNSRLQDELNEAKDAKQDTSLKTVETIHKNLNQILVLKNSLGLTKDKASANEKSVSETISQIKKQTQLWMQNNQASREFVCPYCKRNFALYIRREHWEEHKHPFFKDRVLYNESLVKLYLQQRITKKELAAILECSPDYIDWVLEKIHRTMQDDTTA